MRYLIVIGAMLALPVLAQQDISGPAPDTPTPGASGTAETDWDAMRAQAKDLRAQAKAMRAQGKQTEDETKAECRHKLFMSGCLADARKQHQETDRAAQQIDLEAFDLEQRIRLHDHEVKREQRAEKDRKKEADAQRRAVEIRDKDEKRRIKEEKRLADEEKRRQKATHTP